MAKFVEASSSCGGRKVGELGCWELSGGGREWDAEVLGLYLRSGMGNGGSCGFPYASGHVSTRAASYNASPARAQCHANCMLAT